MHCAHRNPSVPAHYTRDMAIVDTAVHEVDVVRWLFGEEIVATRVLVPRKSRNGGDLQDPLIMVMETQSGAIVDDEISVNIRYGYDIRGEIVGEEGTVSLRATHPSSSGGRASTPGGSPATGASGSSGPTTSSCRNGSRRWRPGRADGPRSVGRLRGAGGLRRRDRRRCTGANASSSRCPTDRTSTRRPDRGAVVPSSCRDHALSARPSAGGSPPARGGGRKVHDHGRRIVLREEGHLMSLHRPLGSAAGPDPGDLVLIGPDDMARTPPGGSGRACR